jgi:hypothetical protein
MKYRFKKQTKLTAENIPHTKFSRTVPDKNDFVTVEVISLKDMPLLERHKQASQPLYLTRYE